MTDWTRDEAFWKAARPLLFSREQWSVAMAEALEVLALLGLETGDRVLDLGCGPGRHVLALAQLGYEVVGVDGSESYLDEVRARADAAGLTLRLERADLREYDGGGAFDAACCLGSTFGLYHDDRENERVAERMLRALRDGGGAVIEVIGREMLPPDFTEMETLSLGARTLSIHRSLDPEGRWIEDRWDDGAGSTYQSGLRVYSAPELTGLLTRCGFTDVETFGGLDGSPYDVDAFRLVAVAWRGERRY
jgi:SAM-dependent methyltransferase